jgi:hypothetical protein
VDVNLPNGRVLRNVPEGTTQAQIISRLRAAGEDVSWAAPKQPSGAETLAKEQGPLDALGIAAGRKTDFILDGLTQMFLQSRGETSALSGLAQQVAEKDALYEPLKKERPFATGIGEAVPAMAGGASLLGTVSASVLPELLSYGTIKEKLKNAAFAGGGSVVGNYLGKGLAHLLKPAGPGTQAISKETQAAADRLGYKLSAGEISKNPAMQSFENYLRRSPGSAGAMQTRDLANQAALNRAAAGAVGQNADDVGEGVLAGAKANIGSEFQRLQAITKPDVTTDVLSAAITLDTANAAKGSFRNTEVDRLVDKAIDLAAQGKLTGTAYKEIRSEISARAADATDAVVANAYRDIRGALDAAAKKSLSQADQKAWDVSRAQWHAYKLLTKGNVIEDGNVSAARLASKVRGEGDALRTGAKGPLYDVARIGEGVKSVPNPTSGQLNQQMLYSSPLTGVPLAIGNKAAQAVYTNPLMQRYLSKGLLDVGPNGQLLLEASGRPAGIFGLRELLGAE